jgi:hypothetical protein
MIQNENKLIFQRKGSQHGSAFPCHGDLRRGCQASMS